MPFPEYIATRTLSAGGAATIESNRQLKIRATLRATKSLIWSDTGFQFLQYQEVKTSELGSEVTFNPPRTDLAGWKDYETKALIDVSAPESFSHRYLLLIEYLDEAGSPIGIPPQNLGPFVLPAGDGVYDIDKSVVTGTVAGDQVSIPDLWSQLVADAQASAAEAVAALIDSDAFIAAKVNDPGSQTGTALAGTFVRAVASTHTPPTGLGFTPMALAPTLTQMQDRVVGDAGFTPEALFDAYSTARSAPAVTYYVSTSGSDSNDGLTSGTAFASIGKAINVINTGGVPGRVYIAGGDYARAQGFDATAGYYPQVDMAFIAVPGSSRPVVGIWDASTGFAVDGTHANTYSKAVANATRVVDRTQFDRFGNYVELQLATSAARCNAMAGTWYCDGTKLYINRQDGAAPSATNTRYYRDAINLRVQSQVSVYLKGIDLEGCGSNYNVFHVNSNATTPAAQDALVAVDCSFKYGGGVGSSAGGGFRAVNWYGVMAAFGCSSAANASDAFGVHNLYNDPAYLLTVNCVAPNNGRGVQSVNAFTLHEYCIGVDIASVFDTSRGGSVHNTQNSKAWLLGTTVINDLGDAAAGGGIPPVAVRAAESAEIWAERVKVNMPAGKFAYQAVASTSKIHRRDTVPVSNPDNGSGVFDTF